MVVADVVTADNDTAFSTLVTGFEARVTGLGGQNVNLTNMGITSNVGVRRVPVSDINNLASGVRF